jgi:hypothetical protein
MTAFAAEYEPNLPARYIGRDAKTGAGSEHNHRRLRRGLVTADFVEVVTGEMRQRPSDCFEVIDYPDTDQSEAGAKFSRIDNPRIVREGAAFPFHHTRYRKDCAPDRRALLLTRQKNCKRVSEAFMVVDRHVFDRPQHIARQHRETHIGTPDVSQHDVPDTIANNRISHGQVARAPP